MGTWVAVGIGIGAAMALALAALYIAARMLRRREPYASVLRLGTRQKLRLFRLAVTDPRVPRRVKLIPLLLLLYLAMPFDIIPDFIPVLGYVDDVGVVVGALALMVWLTPREVVLSLVEEAAQ